MTIAASSSVNQDAHNAACVAARKDPEVVALRAQFEAEAARRPADFKLWSAARLSWPKLDRLQSEMDNAWRAAAVKLGATFEPVVKPSP